jgi:hypothetical protein
MDSAVDVALLLFRYGALVPRTGGGKLTGARQTVTHLVQARAEARVMDSAVDVALLPFRYGGCDRHFGRSTKGSPGRSQRK